MRLVGGLLSQQSSAAVSHSKPDVGVAAAATRLSIKANQMSMMAHAKTSSSICVLYEIASACVKYAQLINK